MKNKSLITVKIIPQLNDNYSYLIIENQSSAVIVIDPAESEPILKVIKKDKLILKSILLTHHHTDHTAGVEKILTYLKVPVYSPSIKISGTTNPINDEENIDLEFINMQIIKTPGHTFDHIVYYNKKNNILFSGDTLFRLGCGRVFEGSYEEMYDSLKKIEVLDDETMVYCGHEYTNNNISFLKSIFPNNHDLLIEEEKISQQIKKTNFSIPFNLGKEKKINPFLSTKSLFYAEFKQKNDFNDFDMFSYVRKQKDIF